MRCPTGIELIKIPLVIGENTKQIMEVQDRELDFAAQKIKHIDAHISEISCEVITNKVIVQGTVVKQLFYVGLDNIVHHQNEEVHFSTFIDIPGLVPGMEAHVQPRVEFIKPKLLEGGKLVHQKMIIEIFVKVTQMSQIFVETANSGPLLKIERVIGENQGQTLIERTVSLPNPAIKITQIDARVLECETEIIENKVIMQGIIEKQIFYIGEDNVEHHFHEEMSFSHFLDLPGAEAGMNVELIPTIEYIKPCLSADGLTLKQEVVLELFVKVTETVQMHLMLCGDLLVKVPLVIGEETKQIMMENELVLAERALKIKEICAEVRALEVVTLTDKLIIQGILHKQIFYVGTDNLQYHQSEDVPFSTFIDLPGAQGGMQADVTPIVEYLCPLLSESGEILKQKIVLEFFVKVTETVQLLIKSVEACPQKPVSGEVPTF